ncbi:GNAT family N-acetyltransferase [Paraburkholderia silvatlantica]|uniref:RimJ/RimL family protein N-acetyltransferase n=1 Tax=Paraburkholderia silvatlantica TaxID=321895 RepID=A0A2U1A0M7_9BURK|nr:GNAT family N-acetyltransferase [Paraburkholderia silvatlantica]MBB2931809.1 RimJ/RimL family protein N-acetyltransferase [Paraburkholderia silvatlantica]PVY24924.1 RimJ/RimL family protein N-acetyltransferase [Paraburkholderia silvatlantica]PXW32036.1 RimJ/RimL family protein N-acetyltransferase [Paraburkholderia silvatlantica]PYE22715.1 RimJ/RimL family protein N-acetyltransferase [Paraburkholderia silvatlantica]TDQ89997.1 RimJ/RimL family protein N-acetyltransferase [Paraburkholderia sil
MNPLSTQANVPIMSSARALTSGHAPVMVRVLTSADRERLLAHFLSLDSDDRLLRFGQAAPDHVIEKYVRSMDFTRDTVFGVFDHQLQLVGVGHLAYLPADGNGRTAEFGVSVLESARGQGIGSKLFERAAIRSRNTHVTTLYMHCLSRNSTMMHIAKKSGMKIEYAYGEADAYLSLEPADQSSIIAEMLQEQAAVFDYALKRQARQASKLMETILPQAVAA